MSPLLERTIAADVRREGRATGWLTIGLLLGPVGLTVGWHHVLTAARWSWSEKIVAALLPAPIIGALLLLGGGLYGCAGSSDVSARCEPHAPTGSGWVVIAVLLGVLAVMVLHLRRATDTGRIHATVRRGLAGVVAVLMVLASFEIEHTIDKIRSDDGVGQVRPR